MISIATVFSGVGTPEWALKQLGVDYECVFACDCDKYARQTYEANHAAKHYFTDVTTLPGVFFKDQVDVFVGGSPCQSFSIAGKRGGFEDTRGTLFYDYARLVKEIQPKNFIWENVKGVLSHDGGKTWKTICNTFNELGYYAAWKVLNTKHYGIPQNRERVYVVGFRDFEDYNSFSFPETFPLKLRLKHLLETQVEEKYYLSDKAIQSMLKQSNLQKCQINPEVNPSLQSPGHACGTYKGCSFVEDDPIMGRIIGRNPEKPSDRTSGAPMEQMLEIKKDGLCATLTGVYKDNVVVEPQLITHYGHKDKPAEFHENCPTLKAQSHGHEPMVIQLNPSKESGGKQPYQQNRVYDENGISPALQNLSAGGNAIYTNRIRRLTERECFRLQGFGVDHKAEPENLVITDDFILPCSATQSYKQAGNGMSVNVLIELFKAIFEKKNDQMKLF